MAARTMLWWIVALVAVTVMFLAIYPSFQHDAEATRQMVAHFPPQLQAMFGLSFSSFLTFLGFYAYTFTYVGLAGAVQAMNLGIMALNREAATGTTEFLLTRPVRRGRVYAAKVIAALIILVVTNLVLITATVIAARLVGAGDYDYQTFGLLVAAFGAVQVIFMSLGLLVSQVFGRIKSVVSVSLGIVFGFFALGMIQALSGDEWLRYASPFKYFEPMTIVSTGRYDMPFLWTACGVVAMAIVVSYALYTRRDVRSAA